ncbi:hypothetical protein IPG41_03030 [Candidatus Peregrinibacteria bacterium]|nr:MAG: hypothetical protein IPG41_03030 [Candidatus Peregrinibacteria bacterium]
MPVNEPLFNEAVMSTYNNEELNISFNYPTDWDVIEENNSITVRKNNVQLEKATTSLCSTEHPQVNFLYKPDNYSSENMHDNVPYSAGGGLGTFGDDLEETRIAGENTLQGIYGDACGGVDYFVEQAPAQYWLITIPKLDNKELTEVEEILNSLSF